MTETKIIEQCQNGDLKAFTGLYDAYIDKIYRFIYYKTLHRETAEDLTSQTFTKAMEAIDSFRPGKGSFSAWLYRIARNGVIDHYRTSRNVDDIDSIFSLSSHEDIPTDTDTRLALDQVRQYLGQLKPEHREIIMLRLWDQLTFQEIADLTGKSLASCKMNFSRAISQLRENLPGLIAVMTLLIAKFKL